MKYCRLFLLNIFFSLLFILSLLVSCQSTKPKDGHYQFELYSTNDLHGALFDSLYTAGEEFSTNPYSLASIASVIGESRGRMGEGSVIFIDVGDHLQGDNSVYFYNFVDTLSPHLFTQMANYLKYDALVVGNHDIEAGHSVYDRVNKEFKMPYLAANAIDQKSGKSYFKPYTILNRGGIKIAIIGMTNPNTPNWISEDLYSGMEFKSIVESLQYWLSYVKERESPHLVVVAIHSGVGEIESDSIENCARFVAANVKGIDLLLASHDHRVINERVDNGQNKVLILESGSKGRALSLAKIKISIEGGDVVTKEIEGETLSMEDVTPDSLFLSTFREQFLKVKEFSNRKVGFLKGGLSSREAYFGPSSFVDFIHTIQLESSKADISFAAPLSYDTVIEEGDLIFQDLFKLYPYENQLYVITMSGREIVNYLNYSYSLWLSDNPLEENHLLKLQFKERSGDRGRGVFKNSFFNFDSAAGVKYKVDITEGSGERVTIESMADGTPFSLEKSYRVALTSYRASGGGSLLTEGASIPKEEIADRIVEILPDIRHIIVDYLKVHDTIKGQRLNQWSFVPLSKVEQLSKRDYRLLFK
ncbi:MAG: 5'-nucleotidase C-terminal domain-containing protein [Bacteroidales bacterium]